MIDGLWYYLKEIWSNSARKKSARNQMEVDVSGESYRTVPQISNHEKAELVPVSERGCHQRERDGHRWQALPTPHEMNEELKSRDLSGVEWTEWWKIMGGTGELCGTCASLVLPPTIAWLIVFTVSVPRSWVLGWIYESREASARLWSGRNRQLLTNEPVEFKK